MPELTMPLSFTRPPLSANDRTHWRPRARIIRQVRHEAATRARAMRWGPYKYIAVQFHYQQSVTRRQDRGNLMPTHKALLDGLVDAGVVPDDNPQYVDELMPQIHPPVKGQPARCWLTIQPR